MLGSIFGLKNSTILAISLIFNGPLTVMTSATIRIISQFKVTQIYIYRLLHLFPIANREQA
jgi:hypothetical protein